MLTNDAITELLNLLKPCSIERISVTTNPEQAQVWVVHDQDHLSCPTCQTTCPVHDLTDERTWRHLDLWKAPTLIHT